MPMDLFHHHARLDEAESELLNVLAHPVRLRLVHYLADGETTAAALAEWLHLSAASVTAHLDLLRDAGIVASRRVDPGRLFRLVDPRIHEALRTVRTVVAEADRRPQAA